MGYQMSITSPALGLLDIFNIFNYINAIFKFSLYYILLLNNNNNN